MSTVLEVRLPADQIEEIADALFARIEKSKTWNRPMTLTEAAKRLGVSKATMSRRVAAGTIRTVSGIGCPRVSEEEIRRLLGNAGSDAPGASESKMKK